MPSLSEIVATIDELVRKIKSHGVDVLWDAFMLKEFPGPPHLCFEPAPERKVLRACRSLTQELEFYGKHLLSVTHLERIILCSGLRNTAGTPCDGCTYSAMPDAILIDISGPCSKLESFQATFHHEYFHLLDYHANYYHPTEWCDIFEASDEYAATSDYEPHDFVSIYAMTSPGEDKAELYSHLITNCRQVQRMAQSSRILAEKVFRLKGLLRQFSSDFDEQFWKRVALRKTGEASSIDTIVTPEDG